MRLLRDRHDLTLVPPGALKLDLKAGDGRRDAGLRPTATISRGFARPEIGPPQRRGPARGPQHGAPPAARNLSWWTTRAREGEVTSGFSKDEILKPVRDDPRAPEGVFTRVLALLRDLASLG
jgi:hypothetical protein